MQQEEKNELILSLIFFFVEIGLVFSVQRYKGKNALISFQVRCSRKKEGGEESTRNL